MSEFIYESGSNSILIQINPTSKNVVFPENIEEITHFSNQNSLISSYNIVSITFAANSKLKKLGNYTFAFSDTLQEADLSNCNQLTAISPGLFFNSNLESCTLPEDGCLESIGPGAFRKTKISFIHIPDTVLRLERYQSGYEGPFTRCEQLETIDISVNSHLQTIFYSIAQFSSVKSFFVPKMVNFIQDGAFNTMLKLSSISVDNENSFYCSIDNIYIIYDHNVSILHTVACNKQTDIVFPETLISFYSEAFRGCRLKQNLEIPDVITKILFNEFYDSCFTSIKLSSNLETISNYSFYNTLIKNIIIPQKVSFIESNAFENSQIETLCFEKDTQNIVLESNSFLRCTNLVNIFIPQNGITVKNDAFSQCTKLRHVSYIVAPITFHENLLNKNIQFHALIKGKEASSDQILPCGMINDIRFSLNQCFIHQKTVNHNNLYLHLRKFIFLSIFVCFK